MDRGLQELQRQHQGIATQFGTDFVTYDETAADHTFHMPQDNTGLPVETEPTVGETIEVIRQKCLDKIHEFLDPASCCDEAILPIWFSQFFTREEITALEAAGIVISGVSEEQPEGGIFIKHLFVSTLGLSRETLRIRSIEKIYATAAFRGIAESISRAPSEQIPDPLKGLSRIPTDTICAAVYDGCGMWSNTYAIPDGKWLLEGFDSTINQYGQGAFEGMVASSDEHGEITLFRPLENAKRFIKSCLRVGMPPISVNQFMEAVKKAVRLNKQFIPKNGKLYVRPFMIGLQGGTGVKPAAQYLFAVEVSPYGEYLDLDQAGEDGEPAGISVKSVTHKRSDSGKDKVVLNYADVFPPKKAAKAEGFQDILLINPGGNAQECASSNFFIVNKIASGPIPVFTVKTPTLLENILPGVTRDSLLELLNDQKFSDRLGARVSTVNDEKFLQETEIEKTQGAFLSGTAAGVTNIKNIRMRNGRNIQFNDRETQEFIIKLKQLLEDARRGKVPGYEHWALKIA